MTGIQGAITAYTLVMATLMITGAKVGAMIGRKKGWWHRQPGSPEP